MTARLGCEILLFGLRFQIRKVLDFFAPASHK